MKKTKKTKVQNIDHQFSRLFEQIDRDVLAHLTAAVDLLILKEKKNMEYMDINNGIMTLNFTRTWEDK